MNFRIGQRIKVVSLNGYNKYEKDIPYNAPKIGEIYIIEKLSDYKDHQVLWLKDGRRGLYAEDAEDASTKLERALQ